ncbi:MAG TPA: DUF6232 family protein [Natronosporangium sp.]
MPTYYRDGEVTVTDTMVEVGTRRFPISELRYVWHERGRPTLRTAGRRLGRVGLFLVLIVPVVACGVAVAAVVADEQSAGARMVVAGVLIALGAIAILLLAPVIELSMMALERSYDRGTSVREIWIRWQDRDLLLLRTADYSRFGKIYRAIQRAVEREDG